MEFRPVSSTALDWSGETLAVGLTSDEIGEDKQLSGLASQLDGRLGGSLAELIREADFSGKPSQSLSTRLVGSPVRKLIVLGLGEQAKLTLDSLRRAAATAAKQAEGMGTEALGLALPTLQSAESTAQTVVEGVRLGLYKDERFKSEPENQKRALATVELLGLAGTEGAIARAELICGGVELARQLVAAPANVVNPITLAETAQELARDYGLELEILEQEDCEKLGMGAFLGVAKASDLPPKFVHLTYRPTGTPRKKLAIIGKGLTFDSGGYNIKGVGSGIETMKMDMGGAGTTFGAARAIAQLKPDVEVHFISAITENMISGHGMRPGDILTASNGKTIEINNTDAEGRLTLADALVFTEKLGVDAIVDLATLTGACVVALGDDIAGLWSSDDALAAGLQQAADQAGEKIWRMPLEEKYFEGLKSPIADMKNTGPRPGGSITAALFLKQFVKETPWAHLDVAGPVWSDKGNGYNPSGATGYGVRTLVNWVLA